MALITLAEFKTYLQITDSSYDAGYSAYIEAVSADVEEMANQFFNLSYTVTTIDGSQFLESSAELYDLFAGMTVTGTGIPSRAIVQGTTLYQAELNRYCTADGSITATFNATPEQIKPVVANMVMYKIVNNTAVNGGDVSDIKSHSIGPVSYTFGSGAAIDSNYGYPKNLVRSIRKIRRISYDKGEIRRRGMDITNKEYYL